MTPRRFAASFAIGVMALMGFGSIMFAMINMDPNFITGDGYPVRSPFAAVRWQEYQPEVKLGEEWFKLVSLDEIPASEIVSFSRRTYGNRWHKRFEEDLVELLTGMKHPPQDTVTLVVQSLTSSETSVREDVPMTYANRRAIWNAAHERTTAESRRERVAHTAVSIDNTEQFRKRIDEFLHLAQVNAGFSGVVMVARGGAPDYQGTFGFSHLASRIPNSLDTPFRIAALSQSFTSAAILTLEADGNFSVDDPVHRYLSEFEAEAYRGITIYHLLTHTSGLPRIPEDATGRARWVAMSRAPTPVNDYVRLACECPLKFQPGQRRLYSNVGYRILSALIVRITGEEYADFMQERLFEPLGLRQSGVARISQPPDEARVAESVSRVSLDSRSSEPSFVSTDSGQNYGSGYGSGGIYASANDLVRWDRVLAGDRLLSAEQKTRLFQPAREYYACGWIVKKSGLDGRVYQTYTGGNYGYFSRIMRIPEDDLVIIALGNVRKTDDIDEVLDQLFRLCRSLPYRDF
ncbi:MAG: serine hydrolase domain-containing protein [Fuerstiella sp.]